MNKKLAIIIAILTYDYATAYAEQNKCPADMVYVSGEYCTEVKQECEIWLDKPDTDFARCKTYKPSVCTGVRVHKEFCIDRFEYTALSEILPKVNVNFYDAEKLCAKDGKRLCKETEWEFACGGEESLPHTTGLTRPGLRILNLCNFDIEHHLGMIDHLNDYRKPSSDLLGCVSPFGVFNMNGNVDEWVQKDKSVSEYNSVLRGGWWGPLRNRCRAATTKHSEIYKGSQVGTRCCK